MRRSSRLGAIRVWALLALLAGLLVAPAHTGLAQAPTDPALLRGQQIVVLNSQGYIMVYGVLNNTLALAWQSPTGGWANFTLGDFDQDGLKEILAASWHASGVQDILTIFDPITGASSVDFTRRLPLGAVSHLLVAADFEGRGSNQNQIVDTYTYNDTTGFHEVVEEWGGSGRSWPVSSAWITDYGSILQAATAGDVNRDGIADLVLVRNNPDHFLHVYAGQSGHWSPLFKGSYATDWGGIAVGKVVWDPNYGGNQVVATRGWAYPGFNTEPVLRWYVDASNVAQMANLAPSWFSHNPAFSQVALANVRNNDPNDYKQILGLRDPGVGSSPFIVLMDAVGYGLPRFEPSGDYGGTAWKRIAAGDVDADGRDEVVVLRDGAYSAVRVYDQPEVNTHALGDAATSSGFSAAALGLGDLGLTPAVPDPGLLVTPSAIGFATTPGANKTLTHVISVTHPQEFGAVHWTAAIVPVQSLAKVTAALAGGTAKVTASGLQIGAEVVSPPAWLALTPDTGATDTNPAVTVTATVTAGMAKDGYNAVIVFVPDNPFNANWVRTVKVSLVVGDQIFMPSIRR